MKGIGDIIKSDFMEIKCEKREVDETHPRSYQMAKYILAVLKLESCYKQNV
jgi:hypothetical protein